MNRRALLACLGCSTLGIAGCLDGTTREVRTLLCNRTASPKAGKYRVTDPRNDDVVSSAPFVLSGARTDTAAETTRSDPCSQFTSELEPEKTYRFAVELRSGLSGSDDWTVSDQYALQIDVLGDEMKFKRLTDPSP